MTIYSDVQPGFLSNVAETNWLIEARRIYWEGSRLTEPTGDWHTAGWEIGRNQKVTGVKKSEAVPQFLLRDWMVWSGCHRILPLSACPCIAHEIQNPMRKHLINLAHVLDCPSLNSPIHNTHSVFPRRKLVIWMLRNQKQEYHLQLYFLKSRYICFHLFLFWDFRILWKA